MTAGWWLVAVCAGVLVAVGGGCESTGAATGSDVTEVSSGGTCIALGVGPEIPECMRPFCAPISMTVRRQTGRWDCVGASPGSCGGLPGSQSYQFMDDVVWIYLEFEPGLGDTFTDQSFRSNFRRGFLQMQSIPQAPPDQTEFKNQSMDVTSVGAFDAFSFANGRLHVVLNETVDNVYQDVRSSDSRCFNEDIAGECYCRYSGFQFPLKVDVDVPVQR